MKWPQFKIYYHCVNVDEIINWILHSTFYGVFNYWSYYAFYLHIINVHYQQYQCTLFYTLKNADGKRRVEYTDTHLRDNETLF